MKSWSQFGLLLVLGGLVVAAITAPAAAAAVKVKATPPLVPAFDAGVSDYVVDCSAGSVQVAAWARRGETVSVDGSDPSARRTVSEVPLEAGQSFEIRSAGRDGKRRHYVRCLPADYPAYEYSQRRPAAAEQYAFTPTIGVQRGSPAYVSIFDEHGAPLWWFGARGSVVVDAQVLNNGSVAFGHVPFFRGTSDGYEIRSLDGKRIADLHAAGGRTDTHELLQIGDGGYLLISNPILTGIDLSPYDGPSDAAIFDNVLEEFDADGQLVWSWSAFEHIDLDEAREWWPLTVALPEQVEGVGAVYNPFHINSVAPSARGYLLSFRRTNSIYRIAGDGEISWKLGGTATPERLKVRGDALSPKTFGGQHDARVLEDGSVTVFDNGSGQGRAPRAVRFAINADRGRARLLDEFRDEAVPDSTCCGSVRQLGDARVISWGADYSAEYRAGGGPAWQLRTAGVRTYRVVPVEPGRVSDAELRAGMDANYPRRPPECGAEVELLAGAPGTPGADELRGRRDNSEYLRGLAGPDRIDGRGGDDCVLGDGGDDRIEGGPGDDQLDGGQGDDRIEGGRGADLISCGGGDDLAIVKGGDEVGRNCERVRRAGAKKPKGPGRDS